MERMIQALFPTETEAFKGLLAIQQLSAVQDISLGEFYILSKDENGATSIRTAQDEAEGYSAIGGGIIGGLIGLLAGPLGFLVGIGAGMVAGAAGDTVRAEGVSDYLDKVSANIPAGKSLLVAHVWEDWETPIDTVLAPLTTEVHRLNIDDEVYEPVLTELEDLNVRIKHAETEFLTADEAHHHEMNEKLLLLKIKREDMLRKLSGNADHQEKQYTTWVDNSHSHQADHIADTIHNKERHDRLESRIAEQKARLEMLRKNR
ncbi:Uncharacterized membrane protein [Pedobacter westerhofensis]|uniref:Uncharacterized membrane protein n=1 Tax=Pedobacter westerhofensis TaxID=425512 RepID=A0A521FNR6_9SPHI|nr:DUF1269 domain-containing protein [Pedobacter westerhofensis]SMO97766.1 Uncharacterized membrane protein [Pedobacter westerhofensis]